VAMGRADREVSEEAALYATLALISASFPFTSNRALSNMHTVGYVSILISSEIVQVLAELTPAPEI
jgi:hypothetical protein